MPKRKINLDVKVQAMRECLHLVEAESVMHKYHLSKRSAYNWFDQILERLPEILQDAKPGPKRPSRLPKAPPRLHNRSAKR
jgi:hypothetical protein